MKLGTLKFMLAAAALLIFGRNVVCEEADECTQGVFDRSSCTTDEIPYRCRGRFEETGTCMSEGLCCCESRDGFFASACKDGDICCDGGCCDPNKSFCCGGGCCDQESEVCCRGECVGKASKGVRIVVPVLLTLALIILAYCMVLNAPEDLRMGRLAIFMLLMAIFGILQVVVALSTWDCSAGVKVLVGLGAFEACLGLLFISVKMVQAKVSGQGILAVFTLERYVIVAVDTEGQLVGAEVANESNEQVKEAKKKLGGQNTYGNVPQLQG